MRKVLSSIVLLAFLSANNLTFVYANGWDGLQKDVQTNEKILDTIENKLTDALDAVNAKVQDPERSRRIEEKQQEIQDLIQQTKEDIKDDTSKAEMAEKMEDVKNTVVLKAVSGVTPYTDATQNISSQVDIPKKDLAKAEDTLISSMESDEWYSLMIKTKLSQEDVLKLLGKYDENLKLVFQFDEDDFSVYELTVSKNSLLRQELLENIDEGEIPNHIVGIQVIKPELLKIGEDTSLAGEDQDKLWGLRKYGLPNYENELKSQSLKLGKKIRVGIIDTGIDYRHPDLKDVVNKSLWYDFVNDDNDPLDDQGHGTHVSGTIAGEINHSWVFWVNPNVELVGLKICDDKGFCPSYAVLKALKYANDNKFDVLNMSLGGKGNPVANPICDAIKSASENGSVVVAAAGNSNVNTSTFVPGGCPDTITVWAVDEGLTRASFSNYGDKVDVSAPGVNIYSTYPGGTYKSLNGTSMATPHIVGLASIVRAYKPDAGAEEIKALFKSNVLPVTTESNKKIAGFVNFDGLMASLGVHTQNNQPKQEAVAKTETVKETVNVAPSQTEIPHANTGTASEPKESTGSVEKPTEQEIGMLDEDLRIQPIEEAEQTRINSAEDTSLSSVDTERKPEILNLNGDATDENSGTGDITQTGTLSETGTKDIPEESETGSTENENASIQNAYSCSLTVWGSCYLDLARANMYGYTASAAGILSYSVTASRVTLYGSKAGTATLYIKSGSSIVHTIVVTVSDPVRNLTATIGSTSIQNGNSTYLTITDGNGGYSVASSNTNVAQVSGSNASWTLYGKSIGSATITVRDAKGKTVTFTLSVTPRSLLLNTSNLNVDLGTYGYFNITDGNGGYALTQNNRNISLYTNGVNAYKAYGNTVGSTTVQLKDSQGKTANVSINVLSPLSVTGFNQSRTALQWDTIGFTVTSGNGGYTVSSSNSSVAYTSMVGGVWSISAVNPGTATITVRDLQGKTASLTLTVNPKITAGFTSVSFDQIGVGFWQARITVSWSYGEIGFENYQKLSKESDNVYLVNIYNPDCTSNCDFNGKLYLKDANGNTVYYQNNRILAYNYDTSSVWIASAEGDDSEKGIDESIDKNVTEDADIWKDVSSGEETGTQTGSESWVEINSVASDASKWVVNQVSWAATYAGTVIKKADISRHLRNWTNLSDRDRNEFQDGIMDTLTTNGLYDTATNFLAGVAIDRTATVIWKALIAKFGKKVAVKLWAKLVPYLWWALLGFSLQQAGAENGTYMAYCSSDLTNRYDGLWPLYYCGKLVVNGMLIAAGVGVSHVYEKYAFRNKLIQKLDSVVLSVAAQQRMEQTWRFVPLSFLKDTIASGIKTRDPQWSSATMFYAVISRNGKNYNLEVLYNSWDNSIWHFVYTPEALGPLPPIKK